MGGGGPDLAETWVCPPLPEPAGVEYPVACSWVSWRPAACLLTQTSKPSRQLCVWVLINKRSLSAQKENAISLPSAPGRNLSSPKISPNMHPTKRSTWFKFLSVSRGKHQTLEMSLSLTNVGLCFPFSQSLAAFCSPLTVVLMTCYPSCPSWLCSPSVLS